MILRVNYFLSNSIKWLQEFEKRSYCKEKLNILKNKNEFRLVNRDNSLILGETSNVGLTNFLATMRNQMLGLFPFNSNSFQKVIN